MGMLQSANRSMPASNYVTCSQSGCFLRTRVSQPQSGNDSRCIEWKNIPWRTSIFPRISYEKENHSVQPTDMIHSIIHMLNK